VSGIEQQPLNDSAAPDWAFFPSAPAAELPFGHPGTADDAPPRQVDWQQVHAKSRLRATTTTFGWPAKLLMCSPPFAWFIYLTYVGLFATPLLALAWGVPLFAASIWWSTQIWTRGRRNAPRRRAATQSGTSHPDQ
jgi:hypothetical protein